MLQNKFFRHQGWISAWFQRPFLELKEVLRRLGLGKLGRSTQKGDQNDQNDEPRAKGQDAPNWRPFGLRLRPLGCPEGKNVGLEPVPMETWKSSLAIPNL